MSWRQLFAIGRQHHEFYTCELPNPVRREKDSGECDQADTENFLVTFDDHPGQNPRNWPLWFKVRTMLWVTSVGFSVGMLSAAYASAVSPSAENIQVEVFGISKEVSILSTAMFLFAFGIGSIPFAPLAEVFGRAPIYTLTLALSGLFELGAGASNSAAAVITCRGFSGLFGSVVLALCGGSVIDISDPIDRILFFSIYAIIGVAAPMFAPVIGGFIAQRVSWRWVYYHTGIFNLVIAGGVFFFCPETLGAAILRQKAAIYRKRSGDNRYHSAKDHVNLGPPIRSALSMPFRFVAVEPFTQFSAVYLGVCFFVVFGYLESLPVVFGEVHELGPEQISLAFLPIAIGTLLSIFPMLYLKKRYERILIQRNGLPPPPEERLIPLLIAGPCLIISLFWLGWTHFREISPFVPIISGLFAGIALVLVFIGIYMTAMDVYETRVGSCLVILTVARYLVSGMAVLTSPIMFRNMKPQWAATLLGCIAILMHGLTMIFYKYGHVIRERSPYAKGIDLHTKAEQEAARQQEQTALERRGTARSTLDRPDTKGAPFEEVQNAEAAPPTPAKEIPV